MLFSSFLAIGFGLHSSLFRIYFKKQATNLRRDTEQQNDSLNAKKSVIPAGMPESSHTPALSAAEGDVKL